VRTSHTPSKQQAPLMAQKTLSLQSANVAK
jgi:hypothetical protein